MRLQGWRVILLAAGLLLTAPAMALAEAQPWTVDADNSSVAFIADQSGSPVEGRFESFQADIRFDPDDLAGSSVSVRIAVSSVDSGNSDRDATIRSKDLFDVDTWPEALFEAASFEPDGNGGYLARGRLTMRDVTQDIALPFNLKIDRNGDAEVAQATGEIAVSRLAYGVGQGQWQDTSIVADEVTIRIDIRASRPAS